ncbi:Postreplication repair protein uvsH/nuvA [Metarhizium album ARSEF 1941]|uniref:Postreplication repair E3 ubiquitin-protein ligase RAD18 n=1 Tax=Metarhizium album (strain ARSEF 1941) TaxID=1081103 RepID=A0A0B2X271_METAS|nr:Postreplication repair protein uvsH/nuvA [Metarhizium album ARSEF 1941]KHN99300.1 Postreplication repair protein uvsH/nuvA [Metarhizium album ARSEF 1941]
MDDVPDSTDWLGTALAGLAAVEAAMRCQVCKDFYKTPMITTCSHTFCSICIRRALSNDSKCPLCRAPEQELKLRSNWSMEESVEAFTKARPSALAVARSQLNISISYKRKNEGDDMVAAPVSPEPKRIRTSARLNHLRSEAANQTSRARKQAGDTIPVSDDDEGSNSEVDDDFEHNPEDGPVPKSRTSELLPAGGALQAQQSRLQKSLERLPALNYSMLKEQTLRKKLAELGISNQGPRLSLERRHKEWITIWNANCDSAIPRKRSQLLQDLDIWEKTQGYRTTVAAKTSLAIKDKNFDGVAWAAKHDVSFKSLIANARRSRLEAKGAIKDTNDGTEQSTSSCYSMDFHGSTENCQESTKMTTELRRSSTHHDVSSEALEASLGKGGRSHASSTSEAMESANADMLESGPAASNSSETETGGQ